MHTTVSGKEEVGGWAGGRVDRLVGRQDSGGHAAFQGGMLPGGMRWLLDT